MAIAGQETPIANPHTKARAAQIRAKAKRLMLGNGRERRKVAGNQRTAKGTNWKNI